MATFSPDDLFAGVEARMEGTGYLARRAALHVKTPTYAEAQEMLRRQVGSQGVKEYDGIRADSADEFDTFSRSYSQRHARRTKVKGERA